MSFSKPGMSNFLTRDSNGQKKTPIWLALRFYQLPIDLYWSGDDKGKCSAKDEAIIVIEPRQQVVELCNGVARRLGIEEGLAMSSAYALCEHLKIIERQPDRETQAISQLAQWCYRWTPDVVIWSQDTILLEVSRCLTLFQGLLPILKGIKAGMERQGYGYRAGLGHTPKAAWLLSYKEKAKALACFDFSNNQLLKPQVMICVKTTPIAQLSIGEPAFDKRALKNCENMGLKNIGDLMRLPAAGLKKRLGKEIVQILEKLSGRRSDPLEKIIPDEQFSKTQFFVEGLTSTEMIKFPMKRLIGDLSDFLTRRQLHCQSFEWCFEHHYQEKTFLNIELAVAKNNVSDFFALTQLKLETFTIGSPIESITLNSKALMPASHKVMSWLDDTKEQEQDIGTLVDRLKHRLGRYAIKTLEEKKEHWPELAVREESSNQYLIEGEITKACVVDNDRILSVDPVRPFYLLRDPQVLLKQGEQLLYQGKPLTVEPHVERIESYRLLQHKVRDYHIGVQEDGTQYWIFFSPLTGHWYLHGVFS